MSKRVIYHKNYHECIYTAHKKKYTQILDEAEARRVCKHSDAWFLTPEEALTSLKDDVNQEIESTKNRIKEIEQEFKQDKKSATTKKPANKTQGKSAQSKARKA